ncbi:MAG: hypothetical protein M3410_09455 [Acidobacteriota bacterium]|nr:hypothetical protein [Acidobacteriota bacterium]
MQDAERTDSNNREKKQKIEERQSDATSKETVQDLDSTDSKPDKVSEETSIPSPDGTPNPERSGGRADGSDTGGPM